jgi:threonine/homoserine/homoserine lactone efflux protein
MNWYYWIQANRVKVYAIIIVLAIPVMLFSKSEQLRSFCLGISSVSVFYFIWLGIEKIRNRRKEKIVE